MRLLIPILVALPLAACQSRTDSTAADNTGRNKTEAAKPVADEAPQRGSDLELTQKVRKAIVGDRDLSVDAHNVKIVVDDGVVTLVGPVASASERDRVLTLANDAGATRVVDRLDIAN